MNSDNTHTVAELHDAFALAIHPDNTRTVVELHDAFASAIHSDNTRTVAELHNAFASAIHSDNTCPQSVPSTRRLASAPVMPMYHSGVDTDTRKTLSASPNMMTYPSFYQVTSFEKTVASTSSITTPTPIKASSITPPTPIKASVPSTFPRSKSAPA